MRSYALTINPGHKAFSPDIKQVINYIIVNYKPFYLEIVNHNDDHYHSLMSVDDDIDTKSLNGDFHLEIVRNVSAYQKYMVNHDMIEHEIVGEMPYIENDSMIDYLSVYGPVKTVQKYGFQALKYYKNLKDFYKDFKGE